MLDDFLKFINNKNLATPADKILVAVSGGIDSIVLLHLFSLSPYNIAIAHCNFQLRDKASDDDELFVRSLGEVYGVPVYTKRFDTEQYAKHHKLSTQLAARHLRYQWFESLSRHHGYNLVATAHHLNDAMETFLYNFARGTGIAGLQGIPLQNEHVIRPILFATKQQIENYAEDESLTWREDSTNVTTKYQRNFIRHEIIPKLRSINPDLESTFSETMEKLNATYAFLQHAMHKLQHGLIYEKTDTLEIDLYALAGIPGNTFILLEMIQPFGFNFTQAKDMLVTHQPGKLYFSATHQINLDRGKLIIGKYKPPPEIRHIQTLQKPVDAGEYTLSFKVQDKSSVRIDPSLQIAMLDYDLIKMPLVLRPWQHGDAFVPLGMKGKKKLSDFMIDAKIPVNLKSKQMVLLSGNTIVWVVGKRIDERFKITPKTRQVLIITKTMNHDQSF